MARGRMISTTIDLDPEFNALSAGAQLIYLRTIPHLDRDGLILGNPFALWSRVAPLMEAFAPSMGKYIGEWVQQGLVIQYESKIGAILFFKGFAKNQIGLRYDRETPSVFPPPPGFVRTKSGLVRQTDDGEPDDDAQECGESPEEVRQESGETPHELEVEVKGEGDARTHARVTESPTAPPVAFQNGTRAEATDRQRKRYMGNAPNYPNVEPRLLTSLTDEVKRIYGMEALIDDPGDDATEDRMRAEAYRIYERDFKTVEDFRRLAQRWKERAEGLRNPRPMKDQLYELAVQMQSEGKRETTPRPLNVIHIPAAARPAIPQ